jgi:2-C-methyl-D-erythritol 4-phosphate cytidylyltransferase
VTTTAILLAGGSGTRLGAGDNKAYLELGGHPLVAWSLVAFERCDLIDDVVLVTRPEDEARARAAAAQVGAAKLRAVVAGGATRHESEQAGLDAIADRIADGTVTLVAIHDAARPFVSGALLRRLLVTAAERGGSVPGLPVGAPFLIRTAAGHTAGHTAGRTAATRPETTAAALVDTSVLRRMQTPQAFRASELLEAYRAATAAGFHGVDTAETVEHHGALTVVVVPGDPDNRKVTYIEDLSSAAARAATWPERPGIDRGA